MVRVEGALSVSFLPHYSLDSPAQVLVDHLGVDPVVEPDHEDRSRWADRRRHRRDRSVVVGGIERHLSGNNERVCLLDGRGPPLGNDCCTNGTPQWITELSPIERRAGVKNGAVG